jgi:trimeric autotransporter adhesin
VANGGPGNATSVGMTDPLPAGASLVSTAPPGVCSGTSTLTCTIGTLASGASLTITVVVTAPLAGGTLTNTATVSAAQADPDPTNNSATATTILGSAASIPTLSWWMLLLLGLAIAMLAAQRLA